MKKNISKYTFFLGFLGFLGFQGFQGFHNDPGDFIYFALFGCFSEFWWLKLGDLKDKRSVSNKHKAGFISFTVCFSIVFLFTLIMSLFSLDCTSLYKFQLLIIPITFAIASILWAFLTYKFNLGN